MAGMGFLCFVLLASFVGLSFATYKTGDVINVGGIEFYVHHKLHDIAPKSTHTQQMTKEWADSPSHHPSAESPRFSQHQTHLGVLNPSDFAAYTQNDYIGRGSFGKVYKVTIKNPAPVAAKWARLNLAGILDQEVALKIFTKVDAEALAEQVSECEKLVDIHTKLQPGEEDYITKCYGYGPVKDDGSPEEDEGQFYMLLKLAGDQGMKDFINSNANTAARMAMIESLWTAVRALHATSYVHHDLKPANIRVQSGVAPRAILIDLGGSFDCTGALPAHIVSTNGHAPEEWYQKPTSRQQRFDGACGRSGGSLGSFDVWSVGIIALEILNRNPSVLKLHINFGDFGLGGGGGSASSVETGFTELYTKQVADFTHYWSSVGQLGPVRFLSVPSGLGKAMCDDAPATMKVVGIVQGMLGHRADRPDMASVLAALGGANPVPIKAGLVKLSHETWPGSSERWIEVYNCLWLRSHVNKQKARHCSTKPPKIQPTIAIEPAKTKKSGSTVVVKTIPRTFKFTATGEENAWLDAFKTQWTCVDPHPPPPPTL